MIPERTEESMEEQQNAPRNEFGARFDTLLTHHARGVMIGGVVLLVVSGLLLAYSLRGAGTGSALTPRFELPGFGRGDEVSRALDGALVSPEAANLLPRAVMVENSSDAWPLSGIAHAQLVIEAPAEGSITRLVAFYDASTTVDRIGPVRSSRPYYVDWVHGIKALYAHVGGSPASLTLIGQLQLEGFRDLNEFSNGGFFWRAENRPAPHHVYTSTDLLNRAAEKYEFESAEFRSWMYEESEDASIGVVEPTGDATSITIPFDGVYRADFEYDEEQSDYIRYQNRSLQKDDDGEWIRVKNIAVILTTSRVLDDVGRLDVRTVGSGRALVFHGGKMYEGEWSRRDGQHIRFQTAGGIDIPFERGTTWISVLTNSSKFDAVTESYVTGL